MRLLTAAKGHTQLAQRRLRPLNGTAVERASANLTAANAFLDELTSVLRGFTASEGRKALPREDGDRLS